VLYLLITGAGVGHKTTMSMLYVTGIAISFYFNRNWSFRHTGNAGAPLLKAIVSYGLGYLLNLFLLMAGVDHLKLPHQLVQAAAILIVAGLMFLLHKYWVFTPTKARAET
jgi:putative flippase GtrA